MKKKLTVNTLALGNLKQRRKQYTIMIIGIILAMVFSSSILFMFSSFYSSIKFLTQENYGKQDIIWNDVDEKTINEGKEQKHIGKTGYAHIIGYGFSDEEKDFDGMSIAWLDETAKELANPVLIEGSYPEKPGEIAVESMALAKMGISAKAGDTITLKVKNQNGSQTFDDFSEKTYKLVGILKNKRNNLIISTGAEDDMIPAAFVAENTKVDLGGKEMLAAYFDLYSETPSAKLAFEDFIRKDNEYKNVIWISKYEVLYSNNKTGYAVQETVIYAVIIILVLMLASCLGVINAFNSNLKDRKKQIGMLRAVGATKRQIINIFGREAFIISLIATPVSVVISYFAVRWIVKLLGENFVFVPNWWVLIACAVFGVICVMIAALIPLVIASKITPIQSIRNIESTRKMNKKCIKSKKEFNVPSLIAKRSIIFGRGRQIAVSIILAVAVVSSSYAFSWYTYAKDNLYHTQSDYRVYLSTDTGYVTGVNFKNNNNGFSENDKQTLISIPYIDSVVGVKTGMVNAITPFSTSDYRKQLSYNYTPTYYENVYSQEEQKEAERKINKDNYEEILYSNISNSGDYAVVQNILQCGEYINMDINGYDSLFIDTLEKYVYDGKINIDKLNSGEEIILVAPKKIGVYFDDSKYGGIYTCYNDNVDKKNCIFTDECDFHAGDELDLGILTAEKPDESKEDSVIPDNIERTDKKVKIGAIVSQIPESGYSTFGSLSIITTTVGMNKFIPSRKYKEINMSLNQKCTEEINKEICEIMKSITDNIANSDFESDFSYQQMQKQDTKKIFVAMIAVVILFFAICLSMINNSITSNIRNSKQKIGTLRAVGASQRELVYSYIKQLLSMMLWGMGIGFFAFFISYLVIYIRSKVMLYKPELILNPWGAIVFCIIVFAVCSINLWLKIKKEMKNSIVENIREL